MIITMDKKTISEVMKEMGRRGGLASVETRLKSGKMSEWSANALKARKKVKGNKKQKSPTK
jgi:Arc/MetJ-type ribon-helix-helix transcriptional regulator